MAKKSIRVCSKRDDEKEKKCRKRIGGLLKLIGYKCPITDRATLREEAERKLKEINERKRKLVVDQEYSNSCSEIKKLVNIPSRLNDQRGGKCRRKVNVVNNHENTKINPVKVRSYIEKIIRKLGGGAAVEEEMELVFQKMLTPSDVNKAQGRLLMPLKQVQRQDVLNQIMERENKRVNVYVYAMSSSSMAEGQQQHDYEYYYELCLGRWDMNGNRNYVLKYHWNQVVKENHLRKNMMVQLWSFRVGDAPCLLLVPADSSGDGGSAGEAVGVRSDNPGTHNYGYSSCTSEDEERLRSKESKEKVQE